MGLTKSRRKTLVLWDVGAVLIGLNFGRFYKEISKLSGKFSSEECKDLYISSSLEIGILNGSINMDEYRKELENVFEITIGENELEKLFEFRVTGPIEGNVNLKKSVHDAGYSIGIFSNTTPLDYKIHSRKYPKVFKTYDESSPIILSFKIDSMKPEIHGYEKVSSMNYDKVIFIDDKISYLKPGIVNFGWNGIHYIGCIDKDETVRHIQKEDVDGNGIKTAYSTPELIERLGDLEVRLDNQS